MRRDVPLTVSSLVSVVLFTAHLAHDLVFGLDAMTRGGTLTFLLIMLVALYGTVELAGRRTGYVVTGLVGLLAAGMPVLHQVGGPRSARLGFAFVWTLLALGASGVFTVALAAWALALHPPAQRRPRVVAATRRRLALSDRLDPSDPSAPALARRPTGPGMRRPTSSRVARERVSRTVRRFRLRSAEWNLWKSVQSVDTSRMVLVHRLHRFPQIPVTVRQRWVSAELREICGRPPSERRT